MQVAHEGAHLLLRLESGEDLFASLKLAVERESPRGALVLSGIGMLRNFELGYFDGKEYRTKVYEEAHELIALHGSITTMGETIIHLHAALASPRHELVGGHLQKGEAWVVNEIVLLRVEHAEMSRERDATGLRLLSLRA
ncbi:MAG: PPC domain-containing DNA-binding protein [Candidatus Thermoplasmatota archaeon]